jgi:hypothetical protein
MPTKNKMGLDPYRTPEVTIAVDHSQQRHHDNGMTALGDKPHRTGFTSPNKETRPGVAPCEPDLGAPIQVRRRRRRPRLLVVSHGSNKEAYAKDAQ